MLEKLAPQKPSDPLAVAVRLPNHSAAVGGSTAHHLAQFSPKPQLRIRDKME